MPLLSRGIYSATPVDGEWWMVDGKNKKRKTKQNIAVWGVARFNWFLSHYRRAGEEFWSDTAGSKKNRRRLSLAAVSVRVLFSALFWLLFYHQPSTIGHPLFQY
jgi:hypothetical protein